MPFKSVSQSLEKDAFQLLKDVSSRKTSATNVAAKLITSTTTQAASNLTSQVKESVSKASRWLWWWGLAAVGMYGMSTTLAKEGVGVLRDVVAAVKDGMMMM